MAFRNEYEGTIDMFLKQVGTDGMSIWRQVSSLTRAGAIEEGDLKGCLNPEADCFEAVLRLINKIDSEFSKDFPVYITGRARNTLQVFSLPEDGRSVVLKKNSGRIADLSLSGQWEVLLRNIFRNYARTAFQGSLALHLADIPTPRPLAWWTKGDSQAKDAYFLYEEISAMETLSEYLQSIWKEKGESATREASELIRSMAHLTRKMHDSGIMHGDIVTHNFLVHDNEFGLALIDTDHVRPSHAFLPEPVRRFYNLRCLRRLDLSPEGQRYFLSKYFGREIQLMEWSAFRFWYLGGFSFRRWFKRFRKFLRGDQRNQPSGVPWWFPY